MKEWPIWIAMAVSLPVVVMVVAWLWNSRRWRHHLDDLGWMLDGERQQHTGRMHSIRHQTQAAEQAIGRAALRLAAARRHLRRAIGSDTMWPVEDVVQALDEARDAMTSAHQFTRYATELANTDGGHSCPGHSCPGHSCRDGLKPCA